MANKITTGNLAGFATEYSLLQVQKGLNAQPAIKRIPWVTANYVLTTNDSTIVVDGNGMGTPAVQSVNVYFPSAAANAGRIYTLCGRNSGKFALMITTAGDVIEALPVSATNGNGRYQSDGVNTWVCIASS